MEEEECCEDGEINRIKIIKKEFYVIACIVMESMERKENRYS